MKFKGKLEELKKTGLNSCSRLITSYREKRQRRQKDLLQAALRSGSIRRIK